MTRKYLRMRLLDHRELLSDGTCDDEMQLLAPTLEERFVGRIADQRVLELVSRIGRDAADVKQFRVSKTAKRRLQLRFSDRMDRTEQFVGKFAADHRADLDHFLGRS